MQAAKHTGRIVGLAVSAGIGMAIAIGGLGQAAADPDDPTSASDTAESGTRATASDDANDGGAGTARRSGRHGRAAESPTAEQGDTAGPKHWARRSTVTVSSRSSHRVPRDRPSETGAASRTADDAPAPTPVQAQGLTTMVAAARRPSHRIAAEAVAPANTAPTATVSVDRPNPTSGATRVTVLANDVDDDPLTYTATRPARGTVTNNGAGAFTYTPTAFARVLARVSTAARTDQFSVTIGDGRGGSTAVRVITPIVPKNAAPVAGAATVGTPNLSNGVVTGKAKATDPNRDAISYTESTTATGKGTVSVNRGGGFTYTPSAAARHGAAAVSATAADRTDRFTVTVTDSFGAATEIAVAVAVSPFNNAPAGTADVDDPDPTNGVVTGRVIGSDGDGDVLRYGGSATTPKGAVIVHADGSFTYTPTAEARYHAAHANALAYDTSDAFRVTIDDGHGGTTSAPVSVVIGAGDQSVSAPTLSTFCGCTLMPADTIFHADLRGLAAMPESDTWIDLLGGNRGATLRAAWAGDEWMGSTGGMPVNVVSADHPKEDVVFNRGLSTTGPGIDDRPYAIPDRPLVEGMPSFPAWDRHLLVFQEGTCVSQELYNVANGIELPAAGILDAVGNAAYAAIWGSAWIAESGAQYDMSSAQYPAIGHANASRLPYLPMILRPDDLERGYIDHMLGMSIAKDLGAGYVWPARAGDGSAADGIPMGTVLRLRADVDISGYAQSTQIILRALQVHGAVIYDSMSPGTQGAGLLAMGNGWTGDEYVTAKRELNTVSINLFEAVDAASLAADPASSWQIR